MTPQVYTKIYTKHLFKLNLKFCIGLASEIVLYIYYTIRVFVCQELIRNLSVLEKTPDSARRAIDLFGFLC